MADLIDEVSRALAVGVSRRGALAGVAAGAAVALPWSAEAKKRRKKKKKPDPIAKLETLCAEWCAGKFGTVGSSFFSCVEAARNGAGPCYDSLQEGPGFYCQAKAGCSPQEICCPGFDVNLGQPIKDAECCPPGSLCVKGINSTTGASGICV
jgi:hypothetical protein